MFTDEEEKARRKRLSLTIAKKGRALWEEESKAKALGAMVLITPRNWLWGDVPISTGRMTMARIARAGRC